MTIYRYLFVDFIKVLFFSILSLVAIIFTTRLELIAKFATMGASNWAILWFSWFQLAYILPIVLPIACLLSAILLFQRLSKQNELTALRAGGLSLPTIMLPILTPAFFLCLINFYLVSEVATLSHLSSRLLQTELQSISPLALIEKPDLHPFPDLIIQSGTSSKTTIKDVLLAHWEGKSKKIQLLSIGSIQQKKEGLFAEEVTLLHPLSSDMEGIAVEQTSNVELTTQDLSLLLHKQAWQLKNDHLPLKTLLKQSSDQYHSYKLSLEKGASQNKISHDRKKFYRSISEIFRRISLAFGTFTFTLMGAVFGISTSRKRSVKGIITVIFLTVIFLISYFIAKRFENQLSVSSLFYLIPHLFIVALSLKALLNINKGDEV